MARVTRSKIRVASPAALTDVVQLDKAEKFEIHRAMPSKRPLKASTQAQAVEVPDGPEEPISEDELAVCRRVRALRNERGFTLDALAEKSGFTKGYLSKIENGLKAPPIASLAKIGRALGQDLSFFFLDEDVANPDQVEDARVSVVHHWERKPVTRGGTAFGYDYVSLAHKRAHKAMDPFIFTFPSRVDVDQYFQHPGEEFIFVLSGKVAFEVVINGNTRIWTLEAGDCVYFDSDLPHRGHSIDGDAQAMVVVQERSEQDETAAEA
ncbi:helix-turn-helix domain-containing protein [Paraburkholderia caledonica]|uniref:helix-turn-helix domain-containing protein n=1 Tax=Paraburkholderia caledonica TaxID=134536 RepID=UPI00211B16A7|nr:XRE family transcriptional regulator [Paraburkholderia caledonica]